MNEDKKKKTYYTPAQKAATAKYNAKAYDDIKFRTKKGMKPLIQQLAKQKGMSVNSLISYALEKVAEEERFDLTLSD